MTVACCWCMHALWCRSLHSPFTCFFFFLSVFGASAAGVIQTLSNHFHRLMVHWQILSVLWERDRKERIISRFDKSLWSLEFDWRLIAGVVWQTAACVAVRWWDSCGSGGLFWVRCLTAGAWCLLLWWVWSVTLIPGLVKKVFIHLHLLPALAQC